MTARPTRDPFAPIEGVVTVLLGLFAIGLLLFVLTAGFQLVTSGHTSVSFATIGDDQTCVSAGPGSVPTYVSGEPGLRAPEGIVGLRRSEAEARVEGWRVCLEHATAVQWVASRVEPVGQVTFIAVALLLVRRAIRGARASGLFTSETARRTRVLGLFLLLATVGLSFASAAGRGVVVSAAVRDTGWAWELLHPQISILLVVVGLGVISFARILRQAVPLQEEVDATV